MTITKVWLAIIAGLVAGVLIPVWWVVLGAVGAVLLWAPDIKIEGFEFKLGPRFRCGRVEVKTAKEE